MPASYRFLRRARLYGLQIRLITTPFRTQTYLISFLCGSSGRYPKTYRFKILTIPLTLFHRSGERLCRTRFG